MTALCAALLSVGDIGTVTVHTALSNTLVPRRPPAKLTLKYFNDFSMVSQMDLIVFKASLCFLERDFSGTLCFAHGFPSQVRRLAWAEYLQLSCY